MGHSGYLGVTWGGRVGSQWGGRDTGPLGSFSLRPEEAHEPETCEWVGNRIYVKDSWHRLVTSSVWAENNGKDAGGQDLSKKYFLGWT